MSYRLQDLVEIPKLQLMLETLHRATGIPSALIEPNGAILASAGWQDVCTQFHRACPATERRCRESVACMSRQLHEGTSQVVYHCLNGLVDTATPILISGCHIASIVAGQLFLAPPDLDFFRRQAVEFGLEVEPYLEAVAKVPVISEEKLQTNLAFLALFTEMLVEIGLRRLEEREAEECLRQARKMEVIGRLAGGVAHDFNNLLLGLMGYGSMLSAKLAAEPRLHDYAQRILELSEKAAGLTRSLLAFSHQQAFEPRVIDVNAVVAHLQALLGRIIGEDVDFQVSVAAAPLCIMADRGQLDQILMNLVTNARDAMPGGGHLRISTAAVSFAGDSRQARLLKVTDFAEVTVEDTGVGMTAEVKERLFEPFFTTKGVGKGTGLGLSMVYDAVKQLSGSISVRSEVGRGSTFTILLPLSQGEPDEEAGRSGPPPRGTETVLLAEDAPDVRNITRHLLEEHGYTVIEAKDGEEAAAVFQANADQVALVLLDVIMPRRGGWQAYEAIKALRPQAKVLFTSGYTEEVLTVKANREQQVHFLAKPYMPFDLLWKVREVLDG